MESCALDLVGDEVAKKGSRHDDDDDLMKSNDTAEAYPTSTRVPVCNNISRKQQQQLTLMVVVVWQ